MGGRRTTSIWFNPRWQHCIQGANRPPRTRGMKTNRQSAGFNCLILEDEPPMSEMLGHAVAAAGGEAVVAPNVERARALVAHEEYDVYLLDQNLPDGTGAEFFFTLREMGVSAPCIMLTGQPEIQMAVGLTRYGLFDYLTKPVEMSRLIETLQRAATHGAAQSDLPGFGPVDVSRGMKAVRRRVVQAAANPRTTVLITGETGVGKDLVARSIHQLSFQKAEPAPPLITLNCSNLPADMFEAELFGAARGAYTGAHQHRTGLAEAAHGSTLFLDEIAEVPLVLQAKLLQFLETREYRRLGETESLHFDGRIIAATNQPLEAAVQAGTFRADLWYRLDVLNIRIPPLRERKEDVMPLTEFLLEALCRKYERSQPIPKPEDLEALQAYDFPGNVRELRNIVERSLLQTPPDSRWLELDRAWERRSRAPARPTVPVAASIFPAREMNPIEEQEYALIRKTLAEARGGIRRAAARLGMSHQSLLRRLEKWPELRAA